MKTKTHRDDDVYPGVRASLEARLATARLKFSVDVNVGDPVIPAPLRTAVPVLLGDDPIEVLAYPKLMVVAEKLGDGTSAGTGKHPLARLRRPVHARAGRPGRI